MSVSRVLIRAVPNQGAESSRFNKGDIVSIVDMSESPEPGANELINNVAINITNGSYQNHRAFWEKWSSRLEFDVTSVNQATDTWNATMTMTNASASGKGNLTKSKVDQYLKNQWNITTAQVSPNVVQFEEDVYTLAISPYMLSARNRQNINKISFVEVAYRQAGGEHDIEAKYFLTGFSQEQVERAISQYNTIISHNIVSKRIVFTAKRSTIFEEFKADARDKLDQKLGSSMYKFSEADVDAIIAAGRIINRTQGQVQAALIDKREL